MRWPEAWHDLRAGTQIPAPSPGYAKPQTIAPTLRCTPAIAQAIRILEEIDKMLLLAIARGRHSAGVDTQIRNHSDAGPRWSARGTLGPPTLPGHRRGGNLAFAPDNKPPARWALASEAFEDGREMRLSLETDRKRHLCQPHIRA